MPALKPFTYQRVKSKPTMEDHIEMQMQNAKRYSNKRFRWTIELPPTIPNAPLVGAVVDIKTIVEVDLAAVRHILLTEEMSMYVGAMIASDFESSVQWINPDGLVSEAMDELSYELWKKTYANEVARELWVLGQRVVARAATSVVQTLKTTKRKRAWRMQYQRNP